MDPDKLIACFEHYLALEGMSITRANAEQRMLEKLRRSLTDDIAPLLPAGIRFDDDAAMDACNHVWRELIVVPASYTSSDAVYQSVGVVFS